MTGSYDCFNCGAVHTTFTTKCEKCGSTKILRNFIPCEKTEDKGFQMDDYGYFRIIVGNEKSSWTGYEFIASLEVDGVRYIGASAYYEGTMPHECVLKVEKVSD